MDWNLVRIVEAGSVLTAGFSAGVMVGFPHVYPEIDQSLHLIIASYGFFAPGPLPSSIRLSIGASTNGLRPADRAGFPSLQDLETVPQPREMGRF